MRPDVGIYRDDPTVSVLASLTTPVTKGEVSAFAFSTFGTDDLLVK